MKAANNICSDPKLLADPTNPVAIGIPGANPARLRPDAVPLPHYNYTVETIRIRAETVSPLLQEILDQWPPEHLEIIE